MANRIVYGLATSENGWPMVDQDSCEWTTVPGAEQVNLQIQKGWPLTLLRAFAADWNAYIEPLRDSDSACWTATNSVASSNHLSGTACDLNWNSHPFRVDGAGFSDAQMGTMIEMLAFYENTIFWGNNWDNPKDAMHVQCGYNTYKNPAVADFISRKIRSDGFSTFRRGDGGGPDAVSVLSQAMGGRLPMDRYRELLPAVSESLRACECDNVSRIAMWVAQIGHESGGLYYTEEIASGAAYEGRSDLGNTQPGDGVRFKGRSWIQITGRSNYTRLSQWAFDNGLVTTPTYFIDNPQDLASDRFVGLGAAWYWVVARPDINKLSDAMDLATVTRRINGGQNGIDDRRARYNRALGLGDQLLALTSGGDDFMAALSADEQRELLDLCRQVAGYRRPSLSPLRWPGEGDVNTCAGFAWATDANVHVLMTEKLAVEYGDPQAISLLYAVSTATQEDRQEDGKLARRILAKVPHDKVAAAGPQIADYVSKLSA